MTRFRQDEIVLFTEVGIRAGLTKQLARETARKSCPLLPV